MEDNSQITIYKELVIDTVNKYNLIAEQQQIDIGKEKCVGKGFCLGRKKGCSKENPVE